MRKTFPRPRPLGGDLLIGEADAREAARDAFFDALASVAPHVLADLSESCVPAIRETDTARLAVAPPGGMRHVPPIGPSVVAWAERHRLNAPWIVDAAILALLDAAPPGRPLRLLAPGDPEGHAGAPVLAAVSVSETVVWPFATQPRPAFRALMLALLADRLDAELERIEAAANSAGATRVAKRSVPRHMRWLVQRVVFELSPERIADDEASRDPEGGPSGQAIRAAVTQAAELIGLPLPALKRGPVPSSPNSTR